MACTMQVIENKGKIYLCFCANLLLCYCVNIKVGRNHHN